MILVTVGTEKFPFDRLMKWINHLIQEDFINIEQEEIIIQCGSCTFIPTGVKNYSIVPSEKFKNYVEEARLIIAHCGEGTIDLLAKMNKSFILVPRSCRFGEHIDEHQLELADMMEKQGVAIARCPGDLVRFLMTPQNVELTTTPTDYYYSTTQSLEAMITAKAFE
ncbi:glycosyltransferase [Gloeothece verrucosa]|uniref:Glycosyltransferase 28 domain protein n=1 Tax=Gloeothece verrucosa (strain PCC 7822) TaxID=497965 RepID=E0UD40_GLOV7|nr:glycosyltransferase [Gloeothece verrucosa]ADN12920.1 Glycosyltransferase 28 domain protein [Gloeothece verrucosa PCC 7822]